MSSDDSIERLVLCENYRSFILKLKEERSINKSLSYNQIAIRAGFKSKSFPRDVAIGKKNLTSSSLPLMIKGLGLKGDLAEFFKLLVWIEHPEFSTPITPLHLIEKKLSNLRSRILQKKKINLEKDPYGVEYFPLVYAATGSLSDGSTYEDIQRRTRLSENTIKKVVGQLIQLGILAEKDKKIFSSASHLIFEGIENSLFFQKHFQLLLQLSSSAATSNFHAEDKLFFTSSFSVKEKDLFLLKQELKKVLLQFIDSAEDSSGDRVASVVCSLL